MKKTTASKIVPPNIKVLFLPVLFIAILLVLSVFAVRTGIDKINQQRRELKVTQKAENTLMEKESELRSSASKNPSLVTPATMALPDSNPALMVISNMKTLSASKNVIIEDLRVSGGGSSDKSETSRLGITFSVSGEFVEALSFMKETKNYLPIIRTQRLTIKVNGDIANIDAIASSSSSAYPDKLPLMTEPIDKITYEEYEILNELVQKQPPVFFELNPTGPVSRPNPFAF